MKKYIPDLRFLNPAGGNHPLVQAQHRQAAPGMAGFSRELLTLIRLAKDEIDLGRLNARQFV
jgi:hypothetical protein